MQTIGYAAAAVGVVPEAGRDHCVCVFRHGRPTNAVLRECLDRPLEGDTYLGSGTFRLGSISAHAGRTRENLDGVSWLVFDADLSDWLGVEKGELWTWGDAELDTAIGRQRADLEEVLGWVGLPVHRIDATGYGLCAYTVVAPADRAEIDRLRAAHKAVIGRINRVARARLVDPQVSDSGTRVTRLPPAPNLKAGRSRPSRTLARAVGASSLAEIEAIAAGAERRPPARVIPEHGRGLPAADEAAMVEAVAPHWVAGDRHALALALAGMMAKGGLPEEQAGRIVAALSAGDEEAGDRRRAVRTSYERVRSGLDARGFWGLRALLPAETIEWIDDRLRRARPTAGVRVGSSAAPVGGGQRKEPNAAPPVPAACLRGTIGAYVRLASPTTEASDALLLGGWLSVLAATCGRRVRVAYARPLYPNLFVCLVGDTGFSRKDHAIDVALDVVAHESRPRMLGIATANRGQPARSFGTSSDISSAQGLVKDLDEVSNNLLVRLRELTTLLDNMRRQSTTTIADKCIELWDSPPETANNSKKDGRVVLAPCLNIVAPTQPDRLVRKMSEEDVASGFANRWLYLFGSDKTPMPDPPPLDLAAAAALYAGFRAAVEAADGSTLVLSAEAGERWRGWYLETMGEARGDPLGGAMRIRHHPMARKVALLYALADGAREVGIDHLEAGIGLVDWSWSLLKDQVRGWGAGDEVRLERRIEEVLAARGPLTKRVLQGTCKRASWPQTMFHRVFEAMLRNHALDTTPDGKVVLAGDREDDG